MWYIHMSNGEKIPFDLANSMGTTSKEELVQYFENSYQLLGKWDCSAADGKVINIDQIAFIENK